VHSLLSPIVDWVPGCRRYWLWTAASVKFLLPFSWLVTLGSQFEWRTAPAITQPVTTFVMGKVLASPVLASAPMTSLAATPPHSDAWVWALSGVWVAGFLIVLFWWWRQWRPVGAALRQARRVELGAPYDHASLVVMSSPSTLEPGVIGIWRAVLLLPDDIFPVPLHVGHVIVADPV